MAKDRARGPGGSCARRQARLRALLRCRPMLITFRPDALHPYAFDDQRMVEGIRGSLTVLADGFGPSRRAPEKPSRKAANVG